MDLAKVKELKVLLDAGTLSQDVFYILKKKIINEEDINLDDYIQEKDSIKSNKMATTVTPAEMTSTITESVS